MSKAVLASLKPYFYYLVGEGIKGVEVRKNYPKAEDWSKDTYFYMSRDEKSFAKIPKEFQEKYRKHFGKVGLRFVCDRVIGTCSWRLKGKTGFCAKRTEEETNLPITACLTLEEIEQYAGSEGRGIYAWHITDLVVYDEPRELSDFATVCDGEDAYKCSECEYFNLLEKGISIYKCLCNHLKPLKRPPQSWCYVEEL